VDATRAASLQRVANRPIVCHVLDALTAAGVEEIGILAPAELVEEIGTCIAGDGPPSVGVRYLTYGGQVEYGGQSEYEGHADAASALRQIARFADGAPTIVHRSDGVVCQPLGPFLQLLGEEGSDIVLLVAQGARNTERMGPATQDMLRVAELDPTNSGLGMVGVCVLGPGVLDDPRFDVECPAELELGAIAESQLAREGTRLQVRVVREWHAFAGEAGDLLDMNRALLDGLEYRVSAVQREGNRFEGRVFIDATATVASSVICGPVIVGAGAHVADSYIGPHTSIGERVRVEGVEIERSIVFAGASIVHVGGRLVGSVVGREARIFRDFSIPRALRLQVADGDEVALC
jgi:glucose-1-phosphate thymidylyltransferase